VLLTSSQVIDIIPPRDKYRIDALSDLPLEPIEYCKRWIDMSPDDRGYRKACIAALAEATGLLAFEMTGNTVKSIFIPSKFYGKFVILILFKL
jgi:hypothetical protein